MSRRYVYEVVDRNDGHTSVWTRTEATALGYLIGDPSGSVVHVYEPTAGGRRGMRIASLWMTKHGVVRLPYGVQAEG